MHVNAGGLGKNSQLRISLLDEGFRPISGYSGNDAAVVSESGFRVPVKWKGGDSLLPSQGSARFQIDFEGTRPEDCALYAVYVGDIEAW